MSFCKGITLKGIQCKNKTTCEYCHIHKERDCCSICIEPIKNMCILDCGHKFCNTCINNWISVSCPNYTCPMCRDIIEDGPIIDSSIRWGIKNGLLMLTDLHTFVITDSNDLSVTLFFNRYINTYILEDTFNKLIEIANETSVIKEYFDKLILNKTVKTVIGKISDSYCQKNVYVFI